jgi:peptidoglycan lytic transglycosylase G
VSEPGGPGRRGRHSPPDDRAAGVPSAPWTPGRDLTPGTPRGRDARARDRQPDDAGARDFRAVDRTGDGPRTAATQHYSLAASGRPTSGVRRVSGVLDRFPDATGPLAEPGWWSYGSSDHPDHPLSARHGGEDEPRRYPWEARAAGDVPPAAQRGHQPSSAHPSAPLPPFPPLPPRPAGVWDRLHPRADDRFDDDGADDDAATVAHRIPGQPGRDRAHDPRDDGYDEAPDGGADTGEYAADDQTDAHRLDPGGWEDRTGGLDVIGAHVEDDVSRRRWRRRGRQADRHDRDVPVAEPNDEEPHHDEEPHYDEFQHDEFHHDERHDDERHDDHRVGRRPLRDDEIPVAPYDPRSGRRRRRRRPLAVVISLIVLAGLVLGIVVGGEKLLGMVNLSSRDFAGQGSGAVEVRISKGDTLSDIARTLVDDGVIASIGPFIDAAESDPDATGIQPGVYRMRAEMSGKAAVDLLLDPGARLVSRVTLREGLTVEATLAELAESTSTPIEELKAAAADPAALNLPAYAGGKVEGFLFPATYDFGPDTTPVDMLRQMVERAVHALDELQIPPDERLTVVTKASLVQAEASSTEDMAKVARVLENRLADGMPLQLDTTVNYANGKGGITTTPTDRANPSPYNTYVHAGLPPGAIDNPGEDALRAVLAPAPGKWRFFVVVDPDTGDTRFAVTGEEHHQNVLLFQQWLRAHPGG